jgi:spermidine/putrescine-binding protein
MTSDTRRHRVRPLQIAGACLAALATVAPVTLDAWNPQGHRLVALVAANHLTHNARQQVQALLGTETLADVAVWADQYLAGNNQTSFWHYVNIRRTPSATTATAIARDSRAWRQVAAATCGGTASSTGSAITRSAWQTRHSIAPIGRSR